MFSGKTDKGIFCHVIDTEQDFLVKTAAEYHPEIAAYINNAQKIEGKTQVLLTALGSGEYWGDNVNGDYFPENQLANPTDDFGYRTFVTTAKVFKHHVNKDPKAAYGDVAISVYNSKYKRVELIIVIDNYKAPDLAARVDAGEYPDWSMGCRVPYDVCSICHNKARTRKEYCEHLRYYIGKIHPGTGKKAYAINIKPKFFDISYVLIGADKIAKTLKKVAYAAGTGPVISSALIAEKMAAHKAAAINKRIPANSENPPASQEAISDLVHAIPEVKSKEAPLPREVLNDLGKRDLSKTVSTLAMLGILPKPREFQRIILVNIGKRDVADQLDEKRMCFDPASVPDPSPAHEKILGLDGNRFDPGIMSILKPFMESRSYAAPHLGRRMVIMIKRGAAAEDYDSGTTLLKFSAEDSERKPLGIVPLMLLMAGLYSAFGRKAPTEGAGMIDKVLAKQPGIAAAMAAGVPLVFNKLIGAHTKGQFDPAGLDPHPDTNDMLASIEARRQKPYLKVAGIKSMLTSNPAAKRLFLGVPAVYMASGILQKQRQTNPFEQEGRVKSFIRKNPDVLGAALAVDAMMALTGKGSTKLLRKFAEPTTQAGGYWHKIVAVLGDDIPYLKTASAEDFLSSSLIWPLAISRANLPARIAGGLFDQAALEASKKLLSNKSKGNTINSSDRRRV